MQILNKLLLAAAILGPVTAEERVTPEAYRLDITLHDQSQGQPEKTNHYSLLVEPNTWGDMRAGRKVPYLQEKEKYNFADVGVLIHARVCERADKAYLQAKFEISYLAAGNALAGQPTIQFIKSETSAPLDLGKSTTVATLEDPSNGHHYTIEASVSLP
jgi:hypothetical protein